MVTQIMAFCKVTKYTKRYTIVVSPTIQRLLEHIRLLHLLKHLATLLNIFDHLLLNNGCVTKYIKATQISILCDQSME